MNICILNLVGFFNITNPVLTPIEIATSLPKANNGEPNAIILKRPSHISELNVDEYFKKAEEFTLNKHMAFEHQIFEFKKQISE